MPWTAPTAANVLTEFTPQEQAIVENLQGGEETNLAAILARVVAEVRDAIRSGGYPLDADATKIPLGLHRVAIAMARWGWLISIPALKQMQTKERKEAAEKAEEKLGLIAAQKLTPEPPTAGANSAAGSWNSENKIVPRMHPVPLPSSQFPQTAGDYPNADAPADA